MINSKEHPVEWSQLLYELEDAHEHLGSLLNDLQKGHIDQEAYSVNIGHIYAHLNRAWNSRNSVGDCSQKQSELNSAFPKDLKPVG